MWESIASFFDKIAAFVPGKYIGIGFSLISIGIIWKISDAPSANWVAVGTSMISLGAFAKSFGAPRAVAIVLSCWATFVTAPTFIRIIEGIFSIGGAETCISSNIQYPENIDKCKDGPIKWLRGE